jgi:urease accessory protein
MCGLISALSLQINGKYRMRRAISTHAKSGEQPADQVVLAHDERHLRRKLLHLTTGEMVMLDLKEAIMLADGDVLVLDDGGLVGVVASPEPLLRISGKDARHFAQLCWHLGNRHLPAEIGTDYILIRRDHVIKDMLLGLGALVSETEEPFHPVRGAYHGHHGHDHG